MRTPEQLIDATESIWTEIQGWISCSENGVEVLPANEERARVVLEQLNLSTKSAIGAVAYHTGGILVENGWLRILGSGSCLLPRDLASWNEGNNDSEPRIKGAMLIADDAAGGFFVLNGGSLESDMGTVHYFAPDTLKWECLHMQYPDFLYWVCSGNLKQFYKKIRWEGWMQEIMSIDGDKGILVYPYHWSEGEEISKRSRSVMPIDELWNVHLFYSEQFGYTPSI